ERQAIEQLVDRRSARDGGARGALATLGIDPDLCREIEQCAEVELPFSPAAGTEEPPLGQARALGKQDDRYQIAQPLGRGDLGEAALALDTELNRKRALEQIREP